MSKTVITIEHLEAGQRRPYADTKHRAIIRAERHGVLTDGKIIPAYLDEDEIKQLTNIFVRKFIENGEWYESRLEIIQPKNPKNIASKQKSEEWEVLVVTEYTG
jgi:hypothetical protein